MRKRGGRLSGWGALRGGEVDSVMWLPGAPLLEYLDQYDGPPHCLLD